MTPAGLVSSGPCEGHGRVQRLRRGQSGAPNATRLKCRYSWDVAPDDRDVPLEPDGTEPVARRLSQIATSAIAAASPSQAPGIARFPVSWIK